VSETPIVFPVPPPVRRDLSRRELAAVLRTNLLAGYSERAFEDEVVSRRLFGYHQIIFNRPAAIRHVLVDNPSNYRRSPATIRLIYPITGIGLFLAEGDDWREQRHTVAPAFAPRTMPMLAAHVAAAADALVGELERDGTVEADLFETMQLLAIDIAGRSMFSLEMREFGPRMRELLRGYGDRLGWPSMLDMMLPAAIPTPRDIGRWRFRRRWLRLIRAIIDARQAQPAGSAPRDLLDLLAVDHETGAPVAPARLADQVATMIAAGHATTGVALFWSLFIVASLTAVQDRIAAEAATLDLGPKGAAAALPSLVYTRAVISETLRLYPPAFSIVRIARRDDVADGVAVPAGSLVQIAPWLLHRHRRLWKEPDAFDPERFMPGAPAPDRFAYLPFGAGPRVCIGAQFALTEAVLVLARLVQAFTIARTGDEPVLPVASITVQPDHPPGFRLRPRARSLGQG
jgi:unspecific monooxygenase